VFQKTQKYFSNATNIDQSNQKWWRKQAKLLKALKVIMSKKIVWFSFVKVFQKPIRFFFLMISNKNRPNKPKIVEIAGIVTKKWKVL
jgi:hypothetical protein